MSASSVSRVCDGDQFVPIPPSSLTSAEPSFWPTIPANGYREKIARITLDSMVQFVGLLDAEGTVLEINQVALDGVGIKLSDVEGKPFWTTFWWQVSAGDQRELARVIRRAAQGEFVRWDRRSTAAPAAKRRSSSTPRSCR